MQVKHSEPVRGDKHGSEIRIGQSSWDDEEMSVKFAWRDKTGKVCRGGEVPVYALPQMLEAAIRHGGLSIKS